MALGFNVKKGCKMADKELKMVEVTWEERLSWLVGESLLSDTGSAGRKTCLRDRPPARTLAQGPHARTAHLICLRQKREGHTGT